MRRNKRIFWGLGVFGICTATFGALCHFEGRVAETFGASGDLVSTCATAKSAAAITTSSKMTTIFSNNGIGFTSVSDVTGNIYKDTKGLRLGKKGSSASITFALPATEAGNITLKAAQYSANKPVALSVTTSFSAISSKDITSDSFADYVFSVNGSITSLILSSDTYVFVSSITFSPLAHNGTVSNIVLNDLPNLTVGETQDISSKAVVSGEEDFNANVTWASSDATVASINETSGALNALKAGTVSITATSVGDPTKSATKQITISAAPVYTTIAAALSEFNSLNLADNGYSSHAYQVQGLIKTATSFSGSNGSLFLVDSLTDSDGLTVFGAFHDAISNMDYIKGGTITALGYFEKYVKGTTTTPEIVGKDSFVLSVVSYDDEVLQFVSWMNGIGTGDATTGMTADHATCLANYKAAKAKVLAMSSDGVTKFGAHTDATITNARTRYENWCKAVGDATPYSGEIINSANVASLNVGKDNAYLLYALLGGSVLAAGTFLFLRKKKHD